MKKISWFGLLTLGCLFFSSCSKEEMPSEGMPPFEESVISYFKTIALGFENGNASRVTRRWQSDVRIYLGGLVDEEIYQKVEKTVQGLNELIEIDVTLSIVEDSTLSNVYAYFGSATAYENLFNDNVGNNTGQFTVFWNNNIINKARIFVDLNRLNATQQTSVILEEFTQMLGLGNDAATYSNSIFYETATNPGFVTEYSERDRAIINLLYRPEMGVGLNAATVDNLLRILLEEG